MFQKLICRHIAFIYMGVLTVLWGLVFCGGTVGPYAWWGLMAFGIIGLVTVVACATSILVRAVRKNPISKEVLALLAISVLLAWPSGWLLGIGQIAYPSNINSVRPSVYIRTPFDKPVIVAWGGDTLKDNYHAWLPVGRWAYDLFVTPAVIESKRLEDYGIYGAAIVAPISGTVVGAYDQEEDIGTGLDEFNSILGNYVFLRIEETGTYLVLAHLKHDSVIVEIGDYVSEGAPLAAVGNTGMTTEPHLHVHHQKQDPNKTLLFAEGLPLFFRDVDGPPMPKGGGDRKENGIRVPNGQWISPR